MKSPGKSSAQDRCHRGFNEQMEIPEEEEDSAPGQKWFENCGRAAGLFPPGL